MRFMSFGAREASVHYAVGVVSCGSALFVSEGLLKAQRRAGPSALVLFVEGDQA
jgi:hypothetical protein